MRTAQAVFLADCSLWPIPPTGSWSLSALLLFDPGRSAPRLNLIFMHFIAFCVSGGRGPRICCWNGDKKRGGKERQEAAGALIDCVLLMRRHLEYDLSFPLAEIGRAVAVNCGKVNIYGGDVGFLSRSATEADRCLTC